MNKNKNEDKNKIYKSIHITEDKIYEMVYDDIAEDKTYFVSADRFGNIETHIESIENSGEKIYPLKTDNHLIKNKVIHFPSLITPYDTEEELIKEVRDFINKYLEINKDFEEIAVYYVLLTWIFEKFNELPYLRTMGDWGSGKSRFLKTIGILCYKPIFTTGLSTPSPIFRIINEIKGTLMLDESDLRYSDKDSEIVKILNSGYQRDGSVLRSEGQGSFELKSYDVFCPKIVATRGFYKDKALESRFLKEEMGRIRIRKDIPENLTEDFYTEAKFIRNKLLMWRLKNYFKHINISRLDIEDIHPRLKQIISPLLSIVKEEKSKSIIKKFIVRVNGEIIDDRTDSLEYDILFNILKISKVKNTNEISIKEIVEYINKKLEIDEKVGNKKIGGLVRNSLQIKTHRKAGKGNYVLSIRKNQNKIDYWTDRFGIKKEEIESENNVNDVNDVENVEIVDSKF